MPAIAKTPDASLLAASMLRLRQGGGTIAPLIQRRGCIESLFQSISSKGSSMGSGVNALFSAPSMAIFKALTQGPKAVEAACSSNPASTVDMPLNKAASLLWESEPVGIGRSMVLQFTALQLCAHADLWREARVLMSHGANPNLFNAAVTAVGLAAYTGSARTLCEMVSFGANATLYLPPEHAPHTPSAHGSTLLHRISNRPIGDNKKAVVLILAHCAASYPDPLPQTIEGKTPLDWADDDETREALLSVVADREASVLLSATPRSRKATPPLRM